MLVKWCELCKNKLKLEMEQVFFENDNVDESVSYTHLDVYKRQPFNYDLCCGKLLLPCLSILIALLKL